MKLAARPLLGPLLALTLGAGPSFAQVFVDDSATGVDDGSSWTDAFADLQDALGAVAPGDEIWVATGTYLPSATGDRSAAFWLLSDVALYGGFDGTETMLDERAGLFDQTILSGDLAGNDGPGFKGAAENSFCVLRTPQAITGFRVDGFTVTGGNANDPVIAGGGGLLIDHGRGDVANVRFVANQARRFGGAVNAFVSGVRYVDCVFEGNRAGVAGGAVVASALLSFACEFERCRFLANSVLAGGAGGGAVWVYETRLRNSEFSGNRADGTTAGGGAVLAGALVRVENSTFFANTALGAGGGGLAVDAEKVRIWNSVFWANRDASGTGLGAQIGGIDAIHELVANVIQGASSALGATDNFGSNPRFVDPAGADGVAGTLDDDLRLSSDSPAIDSAHEPEYEGGPLDVAGANRFFDALDCGDDGVLDRGAHEHQGLVGTTSFCVVGPSSLGVPAQIAAPCHASQADLRIALQAAPLPGASGFFLFGRPGRTLTAAGELCIEGRLTRLAPTAVQGGVLAFDVDLASAPALPLQPGTTWAFQAFFADPGAASGAGLSDAVMVTIRE